MPGGRRSTARHLIVPVDELLDESTVRRETWCIWSLRDTMNDEISTIEWLARRRLIRNSNICEKCPDESFCLYKRQCADGFRWACSGCKAIKSVRDGSFFSCSHLTLSQIVRILYTWACDLPQTNIQREAQLGSNRTVIDWCNFCRDICEAYLIRNPSQVGGTTENGEPVVVVIDETKFFHRKSHWVFGGVERESGKCFFLEVPDRSAATLEKAILQYVLPGTHIVSDGWASYGDLANIGGGRYTHSVVDPKNADTHTQTVEGFWSHCKRKLRRQCGTSEALFQTYLYEHAWRWSMRGTDTFAALIVTIWGEYPM